MGTSSSAPRATSSGVDVGAGLGTPCVSLGEAWTRVDVDAVGAAIPVVRAAMSAFSVVVGSKDATSFHLNCLSRFTDPLSMWWSRMRRKPRNMQSFAVVMFRGTLEE